MTDTKPREVRELERADLELDLLKAQRDRAAKRVTDLDAKIAAAQPIRDHLARDPRLPDNLRETAEQQAERDGTLAWSEGDSTGLLPALPDSAYPEDSQPLDPPNLDEEWEAAAPSTSGAVVAKPIRKSTASRLGG